MRTKLFLLLAALVISIPTFSQNECGTLQNDPVANPAATVVCGNARFTVLTSKMVRMEWAEDGKFEDNATLAIVNRNLPVPEFKKSVSRNAVTIRTADLTLRYKGPGKFTEKNLSVEFTMTDAREKKGVKKVKWTLASDDSGNLMGTLRTLDGCKGFSQVTGKGDTYDKGILSRDGWALVDESEKHLIVEDDSDWGSWVAARPEGERQDFYLFAYGHEYKEALADFTKVAGNIPLPPKYVFGYWWSRYWQYSDFEFVDLAKEIRSHNIPMDVMVIDMDWHDIWTLQRSDPLRDEFGQRIGWTGYTWQKQLFPNPELTLDRLHRMNLKTSLNLHPASGIQPYEDCYEPFVKDYLSRTDDYHGPKNYIYEEGDSIIYLKTTQEGRIKKLATPGTKAPVPFRIDQKEWADAYFNSVIHPLEKQGVDFWWLDWQQYKTSEYTLGLSNTFWLNHTFFNDKVRQTKHQGLSAVRPLIYHRWGGLGSHRYQIGFSGDIYDTWEALQFLPYFTSTSSNVGYGYWGHDIGGHQVLKGTDPYKPEIYTRWLQYGVFTPIFKTHSTKSALIERRVWSYDPLYMDPMREAIRLRYNLTPYIYDAARQTYDTGVSMCRPMYYDWAEKDEAYELNEQFMFGDNILATVICSPLDPATGMAERFMWFPEGYDWYDMSTGKIYKGGQKLTLTYTLNENPWYVKAGAIIPMADENISSLQEKSNVLRLFVAPGDGESSYVHYEDDGETQAYSRDFAKTVITKQSSAAACRVEVGAREGNYEGMDPNRRLQVILEGVFVPTSVSVNGKAISFANFAEDTPEQATWNYSGKDLAVVVTLPEAAANQAVVVECTYDTAEDASLLRGKKGIFTRMMKYTPVFKDIFGNNVDPYKLLSRPFLKVAQCPSLIESNPADQIEYLKNINIADIEADLLKEIEGLKERQVKNNRSYEDRIEKVRVAIENIKKQCDL